MIARIWRGWTDVDDADGYEALLRDRVIPAIEARGVEGFLGIEVLRDDGGDEVEFVTIMRFAGREAVIAFAGEDFEAAYVPAAARRLLRRWDERARHYEVRPRQ